MASAVPVQRCSSIAIVCKPNGSYGSLRVGDVGRAELGKLDPFDRRQCWSFDAFGSPGATDALGNPVFIITVKGDNGSCYALSHDKQHGSDLLPSLKALNVFQDRASENIGWVKTLDDSGCPCLVKPNEFIRQAIVDPVAAIAGDEFLDAVPSLGFMLWDEESNAWKISLSLDAPNKKRRNSWVRDDNTRLAVVDEGDEKEEEEEEEEPEPRGGGAHAHAIPVAGGGPAPASPEAEKKKKKAVTCLCW